MPVLTNSQARRGGATASRWYETVDSLSMHATTAIRIKFGIAGNNYGTTEVEVDIGPNDFATLVETMCIVDRQAAMQAMSVELARQVQTQPERDAKAAVEARQALYNLALEKFTRKLFGDSESERTVLNGISALSNELSKR